MIKLKLFTLYVFVKGFLCPCASDKKINDYEISRGSHKIRISRAGKLPAELSECSGMIMDDSVSFWGLNDSGGKAELYRVSLEGALLETIAVPGAANVDWEALTKDAYGNLYIGDFGNNRNRRTNLRIYKYSIENRKLDTIHFSYADQTGFPPPAKQMNYDAEAFFWHNDSLYIFSKNRGHKNVKIYRLPDQPGIYQTEVADSIYISSMVTDAAISPDQRTFSLLAYGKIFDFSLNSGVNFSNPVRCIRFGRSGQAESIIYLSPIRRLISNESRKLFLLEQKERTGTIF